MGRIIRALASLAVIAGAAGCAVGTNSVLKQGPTSLAPDESIVVLGVKPPGYRVQLFPVSVKEGRFTANLLDNAVVNGIPTDGYLVSKVKAGQLLGLTRIIPPKTNALTPEIFRPCGDGTGLVFEAPQAGKVGYLTDVEYVRIGNRLEVRYTEDTERAQAYLRAQFSGLPGPVQRHSIQFLNAAASCDPVLLQIYMKR